MTVILRGKRMPGTEDGPGPILQVRSSGQRNGGYRLPADAGRPTGGGPARPQGFRPKGRGVAATPESDSSPCPFSAHGLVPVSVTHSRSMTPQLLPAIQPTGPDGGVPEVRP